MHIMYWDENIFTIPLNGIYLRIYIRALCVYRTILYIIHMYIVCTMKMFLRNENQPETVQHQHYSISEMKANKYVSGAEYSVFILPDNSETNWDLQKFWLCFDYGLRATTTTTTKKIVSIAEYNCSCKLQRSLVITHFRCGKFSCYFGWVLLTRD